MDAVDATIGNVPSEQPQQEQDNTIADPAEQNGVEAVPEAVKEQAPAQPVSEAAAKEMPDAKPAEIEDAQEDGKEDDKPAVVDDAAIVQRLAVLLKEVDLAVTSEKMLRKQLQEEFGVDLSDKKALLRAEIQSYLAAQENDQEGNEEEEEEEEVDDEEEKAIGKRKRSSTHGFGDLLSEAMQKFLGMERCPRTQVVKKMWEYIKANDLQDPKNKRKIILDDKMKTIFPGKTVTMFTMQKHLSKHCFRAEDVVGGTDDDDDSEDDDSEEEKPTKKKPAAKKKAAPAKKPAAKRAKKAPADGDAKPRLNGFTKPVKLSPEMAAWMGVEAASRPAITKHLWAYVKERNLQDPSNKQFVLADETLKQLTGEDKFQAFGFAKLIKPHILGYAD